MNKFLAEQLLDFNKKTGDQYEENWGTILKFVHDIKDDTEDNTLNRNNSGIDVFQKQMSYKKDLTEQEQEKKDALKAQSTNKS